MLPRTEFYEFGKHSMFLVFDKKYLHINNSRNCEDNFLFTAGSRFPVEEGNTLDEAVEIYETRHREEIEKWKEERAREIQNSQLGVKELRDELRKNEFLVFYLENMRDYLEGGKYETVKPIQTQLINESVNGRPKLRDIFEMLNLRNFFVVNKRIFLLVNPDSIKREPFVKLQGREYYLAKTHYLVDDVEKAFQQQLEKNLREEALEEAPLSKELKQEIRELESRVKNLASVMKDLEKKEFCYEIESEIGIIGFDSRRNVLYMLMPEHRNKYHKKKYGEGQSAFGCPLVDRGNGKIGFDYTDANRKFLTREDTSKGFTNKEWFCLEFVDKNGNKSRTFSHPDPDNFGTALDFLFKGVLTANEEGRHHIGVQ